MGSVPSCAIALVLAVSLPAAAQQDVGKLTNQLASKSAMERTAAAEALAKLGPKAVDAASALEKQLADKDVAAANSAGIALGCIGRPAFPRIRAGLLSRDSCDAAILAIGAAGADGAELIPDMGRMFGKAVPKGTTSLQNAAKALDEIGAPAMPYVAEGLKLRAQSDYFAQILTAMKDKKVVSKIWPAIVELAAKKAELEGSRGAAIGALGSLRALGADAVPALIAIAEDKRDDPHVRCGAIEALAWILPDSAEVKAAVTKLVDDKQAEVAAKAKQELPRLK